MQNTKTQDDKIQALLSTLHATVADLLEEISIMEQQARIDAIRDFELDELDFYYDEAKKPIYGIYDL